MNDANAKIRTLEQMRWQETKVSHVMEPIQRAVLERVQDPKARGLLERVEKWWQDLPDGADLADVPVIVEAGTLASFELPDDPITQEAFGRYVEEVRVLSALRAEL